jgi:hypothetical protein
VRSRLVITASDEPNGGDGMNSHQPESPHRRFFLSDGITLATLIAQVVLSVQFAATASVTHDEYWHLPVGVLHWKTGRFDWEPLNPPLLRLWAAIPVVASSKTPPPAAPTPPGDYGNAFVADHSDSFPQLYFRGRLMMIAASLITSLLIVMWSRSEFGPLGGCLSAIAWCLSPTTIANGSLVATDMGAALGFIASLWSLRRFAAEPSWRRAVLWGAALGLAQGMKYTCVLLYPLSLLGWLQAERTASEARPGRTMVLLRFVSGLAVSLLVLNASYLGSGSFRTLNSYQFSSQAMVRLQARLSPLGALPMPVPEAYLRGIDQQRKIMEQDHPVYLDEVWQLHGFPTYYLAAITYKTPLGMLALFVLAVVSLAYRLPGGRRWRTTFSILIPAGSLLLLASLQNMQLGLRYILPTLALAGVFIGRSALRFAQPGAWPFKFLTILAAIASLAGLRNHPYELAYFNEFAGGPENGYRHLVDSNLDWGQDLQGLKDWIDANKAGEIGLAYFGTVPPEALGIRYHVPPSRHPEPGLYAISVNFVAGRPHEIRNGQGGSQAVDLDEFFYFRMFQPIARIGGSINIYRITNVDLIRFENVMRQLQNSPAPP